MSKANRITVDLLDDGLRQIIMDGGMIKPANTISDLPKVKTEFYYRILSGAEKNNIYVWDDELNDYSLIGADDKEVAWDDLTGVPVSFKPTSHTHTESAIIDLDKYKKVEVDTKLLQKADLSHKHVEADITDLDKYTKSEVDAKLLLKANSTHIHPQSDIEGLVTALGGKVDKVSGKGLSANDFSNEYKTKLDSLSNNASVDYESMSAQLLTHTSNANIHLSTEDKNAIALITAKADKTYVDNQLLLKASASTVDGHTSNSTIHVTQAEKDIWNAGGTGKADLTGATFTGVVSAPSVILPHGTGVTSPVNGQIWTVSSGMYVRLNGVSRVLAHTSTWSTVTQAEAEEGVSTAQRLWTAQRVRQAIEALKTPVISVGLTQPTNGADVWYKEL